MEPSSSSTSADSSKSRNVTSIHLNLYDLMASNLLAAHKAETQKSHAEALAAANMLDQIEEDLDVMKAKDLSKALILEAAVKFITIKSADSIDANDAKASIYAKTAVDSINIIKTSAIILQKPLLKNNLREEKTLQILACLPSDHLAHKASSIATLRKLKTELLRSLTAVITAVQVISSGIVIISRSLQDMKTLLAQKNVLAATLINAQIEKKEH
ncbi:uncharacterized protein PADG_12484 [Paracoccidioides brasiliensis Pb18]|uniref:Uncharacterized protein n=1 Tax=Paracoccidioides brasiliensis (strain Pb18) TaxID=502780 RepID=A0A0A0HVG9_PARBD|nr:uncharacterized protein PADG_12484 [Paracoccidioides brasiliensis Pb18]KGM91430.1 hypothetical protein PADG_12484 [Paracoccidioides brasiliensis Pb18]